MKTLNEVELKTINGGNVPTSYYMDGDTIHANGNCFKFAWGVIVGFFS